MVTQECVTKPHKQIWETRLEDKALDVRYGRIGTNGQSRRKKFTSHDQVLKETRMLVREKMRKAYLQTDLSDVESSEKTI